MRQKHAHTRSFSPKNFSSTIFLNDEHWQYLQYFQSNPTCMYVLIWLSRCKTTWCTWEGLRWQSMENTVVFFIIPNCIFWNIFRDVHCKNPFTSIASIHRDPIMSYLSLLTSVTPSKLNKTRRILIASKQESWLLQNKENSEREVECKQRNPNGRGKHKLKARSKGKSLVNSQLHWDENWTKSRPGSPSVRSLESRNAFAKGLCLIFNAVTYPGWEHKLR